MRQDTQKLSLISGTQVVTLATGIHATFANLTRLKTSRGPSKLGTRKEGAGRWDHHSENELAFNDCIVDHSTYKVYIIVDTSAGWYAVSMSGIPSERVNAMFLKSSNCKCNEGTRCYYDSSTHGHWK